MRGIIFGIDEMMFDNGLENKIRLDMKIGYELYFPFVSLYCLREKYVKPVILRLSKKS
jgi:hypothetical protein